MLRIHCSIAGRAIAIAVLALGFGVGLRAAVAGQAAASQANLPANTTNAPEAKAAETGAAKVESAGTDASKPGGPTDPKARKTFASAIDWENHGRDQSALDDFRKANKQDGGHCWECLLRAYGLAFKLGDYEDAAQIARDWLPTAKTAMEKAYIHYALGSALQGRGIKGKKESDFTESCDELKAALQIAPGLTVAQYALGVSLAHLHRDEEARAAFEAFLRQDKQRPDIHQRAARYLERVELVRAKMAPAFSVTTLDGRRISMDDFAGKVVLIDFWATWCGPCVNALPHMRYIAKKFDGQPFVALSISLDSDQAEWMHFVQKNGMTWLQYRDGGFDGRLARAFNVTAIPATFSIDADGVLEDQHVGDAEIEGKLKKMIARAVEMGNRKPEPAADKPPSGAN
jgi:thiol-disulfide isomerase/thioredoxin